MKKYYLLSAFGKDRPGIVAGVSQILLELGGNIQDATMTRLGGEFTMMLVTALPSTASSKKWEKSFRSLEKKLGLRVESKSIPASLARRSKEDPAKFLISVYGADHPGIVHKITQALAQNKVSITDLQTKVIGNAHKPVYVMLLELVVPPSLDTDILRTALDQLRQDLNVEITLQDIDAVAL